MPIAAAALEVQRVQAEALKVTTGGLRTIYRTLELPGRHPLKDTHAAFDAAVLAASFRVRTGGPPVHAGAKRATKIVASQKFHTAASPRIRKRVSKSA